MLLSWLPPMQYKPKKEYYKEEKHDEYYEVSAWLGFEPELS